MAEGGVEEESGDMLGPATVPIHQSSPSLNAKSEESDCESSAESPEPASTMGMDGTTNLLLGQKVFQTHAEEPSRETKLTPTTTTNLPYLNGSMAGLNTFQDLKNLTSLQQSLPQATSITSLQGMVSLPSNAPLNLTVTPPRSTPSSNQSTETAPSPMPNGLSSQSTIPPLLASQQPAPMPQFILASGQLVQGIQGAQLLIPTSQGLATQTILTIPVNHVNSNDQMVNLALSNGQVVTTTLANLQAMAHSNLFSGPNNAVPTTSPLFSNGSTQQLLQSIPQMLNTPHLPNPQPTLLNPQPLLSTTSNMPSVVTAAQTQQNALNQRPVGHYPESKLHGQSLARNSSPPNCNGVGRLPTNGELTITTTHAPSMGLKRSPSLSPNDNSSSDLLIDSPNQPTINQTNSNVVDGINLDEIKDFAKAFKLRRLSLGLTQTQVGQALSVTEGPAYSQSAICSALASQMFAAAQLSSQQQAMFEKLDITPKSAQKIKPVLERWMKEAEERYKSGQNHLTDFIGIEPSKKRKRRTSFTPQALELLNAHFERNTHPSGTEITGLAHQLGYEREVIRIWFCNKRQALKNTVRMMSKGMV